MPAVITPDFVCAPPHDLPASLKALETEEIAACEWLDERVVKSLLATEIRTIADLRKRWCTDQLAGIPYVTRPFLRLIRVRLSTQLVCVECQGLRYVHPKSRSVSCHQLPCRGVFVVGRESARQLARVFPQFVIE